MPSTGDASAIDAALIFDGDSYLENHSVVIRGERIERILPTPLRDAKLPATSLQQGVLAPGFIDLQVNGGGGLMLNNAPSSEAVAKIAQAHRGCGTTALLPTVMSDSQEVVRSAADAVREAQRLGHPGVLGLHIEGPFFEPRRRGAHRAEHIRKLTTEDVDWLCSIGDLRLMLTLAPEHCQPADLSRLRDSGLLLCGGHTEASYAQINAAADSGLVGITHLYNAMSQITPREPGTVGAALENDELWVAIIADGHHVHPANIRSAFRAKPRGRMVLVSDAMATVGAVQDSFELYGEAVAAQAGRLVNADGVLAGSAIGLIDAVKFAVECAGIDQADCLRMASRYPAHILGLGDTLGCIAPGFRADLVHFDPDYQVQHTWCAGAHVAHG
jgi:N-acetylglucosamine-6-phosphate deacetylase